MNSYNPMLDYQRNQLMAYQNMLQQQQMANNQSFNPYPQPQQPQYFVKQVGSIDEVKGYPVDPNTIYMFPDTGTGKIYLKKLNMTNGKSELYIYTPSQEGEVVVEKDPNEMIIKRLDEIEKSIGGIYESISSNAKHPTSREESNGGYATEDGANDAKTRPAKVQSNKTDA